MPELKLSEKMLFFSLLHLRIVRTGEHIQRCRTRVRARSLSLLAVFVESAFRTSHNKWLMAETMEHELLASSVGYVRAG